MPGHRGRSTSTSTNVGPRSKSKSRGPTNIGPRSGGSRSSRSTYVPGSGFQYAARPTDNAAFEVFRDSSGSNAAKAREDLARRQAAQDLNTKRFGEDQTRNVGRAGLDLERDYKYGNQDRTLGYNRNIASTELNRSNIVGDFNRSRERGLSDSQLGYDRFALQNALQQSRGLENLGRQEEVGLRNINRSREAAGLYYSGERIRQRDEFSGDVETDRSRLLSDLALERIQTEMDKARYEGRLVEDSTRGIGRADANAALRSSQLGEDLQSGRSRANDARNISNSRRGEDDRRARSRYGEDDVIRQDVLNRQESQIASNQASGASYAAGVNRARQRSANVGREQDAYARGTVYSDNAQAIFRGNKKNIRTRDPYRNRNAR